MGTPDEDYGEEHLSDEEAEELYPHAAQVADVAEALAFALTTQIRSTRGALHMLAVKKFSAEDSEALSARALAQAVCAHFLDHVEDCGDADEGRRWLEQFMAYLVQGVATGSDHCTVSIQMVMHEVDPDAGASPPAP